MMIDLVKTVSTKMKGFSQKETLAYYRDIVQRAWGQVEAADTPEVKSQKFDEVMEWTMLDRDYDQRTRRVFTGPIFVPMWWGHFDPTFHGGSVSTAGTGAPVSMPGGGGGVSLPHLPGSDFAASMVNSVQTFSGNVIGNLTDFTGKITSKTNPVPVVVSSSRSYRSGGGGGGRIAVWRSMPESSRQQLLADPDGPANRLVFSITNQYAGFVGGAVVAGGAGAGNGASGSAGRSGPSRISTPGSASGSPSNSPKGRTASRWVRSTKACSTLR